MTLSPRQHHEISRLIDRVPDLDQVLDRRGRIFGLQQWAIGPALDPTQDDIGINGWAVETRVYAEDPYRHFLPSTGRLIRYWPSKATRSDDLIVRVDDGVADGGEVSMFYDPMIAKLITWAPTREGAIEAQVDALDQFVIDGISDNVDFLSALMQHPRFRDGNITTGFIAEEYPDGFHGAPADGQALTPPVGIRKAMAVR
jgi:propionyl-CoA carboxylase alpha chain